MATTVCVVEKDGRYHRHEGKQLSRWMSPENMIWIDADERTPELETLLEQHLRIHPLVVEDVFSDRLTPKVEDYGDYLYLVMHAIRHESQGHGVDIETAELDVVVGSNWVFTHHDVALPSLTQVSSELERNPRTLHRGPAYMAHAILDRLTDNYLPVVDHLDELVDDIEKRVVSQPDPAVLAQVFALKRTLQRLRRLSMYQRDLLMRLSRGEFDLIPEKALPFYRDVHDHFVRIADLADSYREMVTSALDIYMSVTANRTNDIMKVLAMISTIMLPLSFIAGVYGMNFEHMPETKWVMGYPMALGLMVVVAGLFTLWFRHKRWL